MSTHDADDEAERRTMTRDPNATSGPVVETGETDGKGNHVTIGGSTHLTANIDGKWYVVNSRGEKLLQKAYSTESEAVEAAQKRNPSRGDAGNVTIE
jgi:hypothetical protein